MKYLIYDLFSGVGFCNQLFSLETAIYLANITSRKLILLIKNPLCHCGRASWDYGHFLDYFSDDYKKFLPYGIELHYGNVPEKYTDILSDDEKTSNILFGNNFSQIGFIDKKIFVLHGNNLNNVVIHKFLNGRKPYILDVSTWSREYIYLTESNASRCFSNFLTSTDNYHLMSNICESLTHLHESFYCIFNQLSYPDKYMGIHFRFGDTKWSTSVVNSRCDDNIQHVLEIIEKHKDCNKEIIIMSDRKDTLYLAKISNNIEANITFTEDIIESIDLDKYFPNITNKSVVQFLLQKYICEQANVFIGYEGSTVSNHIQYINYIRNKPYQYYTHKDIVHNPDEYSWYINGVCGGGIGWKLFFPDNIFLNKLKIITLTNDGYKHLTDNLLISMAKLGIEKSLKIYCIGNESYTYFKNKYCFNEVEQVDTNDFYLNNWIEYKACQNKDEIGKRQWASITSYKIYAIHNELITGNDVIFIDGDIVFEKDPFKYMMESLEPETELLIQNDHQDAENPNMCTGFFWMKSNENTINITNFETITKNIDSFQNDQQYIRRFSKGIKHKYLDLGKFPNGKYYRDNCKTIEPYIIHFNYDVSDYKIKRMKHFKKWYLDDENINSILKARTPFFMSSVDKVKRKPNNGVIYIHKPDDSNSICQFLEARNIKIRQGYITQVLVHAKQIVDHLKSICDIEQIKNVLEVGFLAGHSAELFLKLNDHVKVTSIDESVLQSVKAGKEYIDVTYPERHTLIKGNSNNILKDYIMTKSEVKYDIILIDGSFKYDIVKQDIILSKQFAHENTILIINGVLKNKKWAKYWTVEITDAIADLEADGFINNLHNIDIDVGRGTVTCKYSL
jgi:predicted O-methyltransferase YrrM